ncbi:MAG: hypothetical protein ISS45_04440 [Candidatus Omnitrophica bacterium]|nr:hypothetical protein [Candidatus Omnitrophota bacterium]
MNRLNREIKKKRFLAIIPLISFLSITILPFTENLTKLEAAEFGMSAEFLIQSGITFYDQGRFIDAMNEFKKVLIVNPRSAVAKTFLRQIQKELFRKDKEDGEISKFSAIEKALNQAELKQEVLKGLTPEAQEGLQLTKELVEERPLLKMVEKPGVSPVKPERTIVLDEQIKATQPNTLLELEMDSTVLIQGDNIKRFLNTTPEKIMITRQDQNTLLITGTGIGKGIFHVWDNSGRWTFNFQGKHKKFFGTFGEEYDKMAQPIGLSEPFKITYSFDWSSFHTGRRIDTTQRQSLSFNQSVTLKGETPYGNYYSYFNTRRLNKKHEIENFGMGLTDGHFWGLEHLNLRLFDFSPGFSAYKFPSADLRGAKLNAPMFNDKINYTAFWGGLPEGNYTHLSPGLGKTRDAYLEGIGLQYRLSNNAKYKFYYAHTYGSELSSPVLTDSAFGLGAFYKIGKLNFDSEIAYDDADHISYTSSARLTLAKTRMFLDFREEDRDFVSPLGGTASGGSTSAKFGISFYPTKDFSISNSFSATRDRNLFNPDDANRPNYTFGSEANWRLDPFTNVNIGYSRDDTKGSVSPSISETKKFGLRKQFFFIKKINSYFNYTNLRNKYFVGSTSNYDQNTFRGGLGFNLLGDLYWSISKSVNFTENRITKEDAKSHVLETSLSYYSRIFDSPFYGRFRISFRDEEEAESALSFLSGEDRLEFAAELDYRPNPYIDAYLSCRVANVWAENAGAAKHLDAEVRYGLRLAWDTGLRWNTKGNVGGFVFYDLNGDSIKDGDEEGVEDVVINATAKKTDTTNDKGYYFIKNIVGKKARVSIDMNTIPRGYTLTTPSFYDTDIKHGATKRLDFGITTQAEIVGVIFIDTDGNNKFDRGEEGLNGVVFIIDDVEKVVTDQGGQYLFRGVSPGEHTLRIDLKTLPTKYIPKVPLKKKIILEEGATFFYHVPLRAAQQIQ